MALDGGTAVVNVVANGAALSGSIASGVKGATSSIGGSLKTLGATLGITLGAAFAVNFAKKSLEAVDALDKSAQRLAAGFQQIGVDGATALQPILDWSQQFSLDTGINQADIVDMSSKLLGMGEAFFKAAGPDASALLEQLTKDLEDMSAATGKSASMLMRSLGPAILNTPVKAIPILEKLGALTVAQADHVTKLATAQGNAAATGAILNDIQKRWAGTAAATATPLDKLHNAVNQLEIAIGRALIPIIEKLVPMLDKLLPVLEGVLRHLPEIAAGFALWFTVGKILEIPTALEAIASGLELVGAAKGADLFLNLAIGAETLGAALEAAAIPAGAFALTWVGLTAALTAWDPLGLVKDQTAFNDAIGIGTDRVRNFGSQIGAGRVLIMGAADASNQAAASTSDWGVQVEGLSKHWMALAKTSLPDTTKAVAAFTTFLDNQKKAWSSWAQSSISAFDLIGQGLGNVKAAFDTVTGGIVKASATIAQKQRTIASDLGKLDDVKIGQNLKTQIENLGPDVVHEFLKLGPAGKKAFEDNMRIYLAAQKVTNDRIKAEAKAGFTAVANSAADGYIHGLIARSPDITAAGVRVIKAAIAAAKAAAGIKSPSSVFREIGVDMVRGLALGLDDAATNSDVRRASERMGGVVVEQMLSGMQNRFTVLTSQLKTLVPMISKALGVGATDQAKAFLSSLDALDKRFTRLQQKVGDFRSAIRGAFSSFGDLFGTIGTAIDQFSQDQAQFVKDQANFLDQQAQGQTGLIAPVAPTAPDLHALIAAQVAQASQLAALLKQLQQSGLSTPNLANLAGQAPASAIAEAQALLQDPALIAELNKAQQTIADITQTTVDKLTNAAFGDQVQRLSDQFARLVDKLRLFIEGIDPGALTSKTKAFIDALEQMTDVISRVSGQLPNAGPPGQSGGGGQGGPHITVQNLNVTVPAGADAQATGRIIRDELLTLKRLNNGLGI